MKNLIQTKIKENDQKPKKKKTQLPVRHNNSNEENNSNAGEFERVNT